jgi:hypothetical protein
MASVFPTIGRVRRESVFNVSGTISASIISVKPVSETSGFTANVSRV